MLPTILVVDDESEFLELLTWVLNREGYGVEVAADGVEAISKANSTHPKLIVLDLMLPELDGTAVCEILRQTPDTSSTPILMLTGCATESCKRIALDAGATDYLTKPCSVKFLVSRIRDLLNGGTMENSLAAVT